MTHGSPTRVHHPQARQPRTARSVGRLLFLAAIPAFSIAPSAAFAFLFTGTISKTTATITTCDAVTPIVYATAFSVPASGSGIACTSDPQCTGAGEYCAFPNGTTTGTCRASGLLSRGGIQYVAGNLIDVDVTVPTCTVISDVLMGGTSLTGSGIDAQATPGGFTVISSTSTTVNGLPARRYRVRIQFTTFGDGRRLAGAVGDLRRIARHHGRN